MGVAYGVTFRRGRSQLIDYRLVFLAILRQRARRFWNQILNLASSIIVSFEMCSNFFEQGYALNANISSKTFNWVGSNTILCFRYLRSFPCWCVFSEYSVNKNEKFEVCTIECTLMELCFVLVVIFMLFSLFSIGNTENCKRVKYKEIWEIKAIFINQPHCRSIPLSGQCKLSVCNDFYLSIFDVL